MVLALALVLGLELEAVAAVGGTVQLVRRGLAAAGRWDGAWRERAEGAVQVGRWTWKVERGDAAGEGEEVKVDMERAEGAERRAGGQCAPRRRAANPSPS